MKQNPQWLLERRRNIKSQYGEDGIIEAIFEVLGERSRWCVELGALNGTHDSNTWHLINERHWSAVLIEADPTYFEKLKKEYAHTPTAHCVNEFVSFEGPQSLDEIFARTPIPIEFDFLSLDIDGNDYHVWDSLIRYRPRVVVVEFNPSIPNDIVYIQPRDMSVFQGSSLRAFVELGAHKGYELAAVTDEGNAFFIVREEFEKLGITDNSIDALHTDKSFETRLFQLYDGTLMLAGNTRLIWHNLPIDQKKIQVLSRHARRYPARIHKNTFVRRVKFFVRELPFYNAVQKARRLIRGR